MLVRLALVVLCWYSQSVNGQQKFQNGLRRRVCRSLVNNGTNLHLNIYCVECPTRSFVGNVNGLKTQAPVELLVKWKSVKTVQVHASTSLPLRLCSRGQATSLDFAISCLP